MSATRFLIISDAAQAEPASRIPGLAKVYTVISREQALNGHAAEIAGQPIVIWPDRETISRDWGFARELALLGEVKLLDVSLGFVPKPQEMLDTGWDYAQFLEWITGKAEHSTNIVKLVDALVDANIDVPYSDPPDADTPPREADPAMDGSLDALSAPPADALDGPDGSEPYWEADTGHPMGSPVDYHPGLAGRVYAEPGNDPSVSEWPAEPTNWWIVSEPPVMRSEWLPAPLADYAMHEAETMGVDPGIMGMYLVGFCCGAITDALKLQVKADNPRWLQSARLWLVVVGTSATKKTPALKEIDGPAWMLERQMRERSIAELDRFDRESQVYEQQMRNYATATAKGETVPIPQKPSRPERNRLLVGDTTREALADTLMDQGDRGVMLLADEIVSVFGSIDQYKKSGNDRQFYLQGFDGGPFPVDRKGRDIMVQNLGFTIVGGTQPSALRKVSAALALESDGLMQRFIPYVAKLATEDLDRPAHHEGHARFADILERLMEIQFQGPCRFSVDAQLVRREFSRWAWNAAKGEWLGDALRSHVSKYDTFFARLCLTYHSIACVDRHQAYIDAEIPAEIAEQVASLMRDCLYHHAEHFYGHTLSSASDLIHHVREVASKILAFGWEMITPTLLAQNYWGWRSVKDWEKRAIFAALAEAGWTRSDDRRGYVPGVSIKFHVNPSLPHLFSEQAEIERRVQAEKSERRSVSNLKPRGKARTAGED